ncbi:MAG: nicotinate (nicotinamide) nucleotide adenylyltransferase [Candidatus Muirbacterium halophilum]|nr:nicotinate (nicotinamide) nucleotide adenylyltransferase [Candidatus Muirbacterium halophilum]MCK9475769.1 nicotinate (nicotinamide) nucleotide adenylyltransferase [Candidatus Muirbacterium halophilum]
MKKTAVFGGTFDPLHIGHVILAQFILNNGYAEKILFIPSFNPPHKQNKVITEFKHRFNMIKIETDKNCKFEVSDIEKNMAIPSYTYNTLKKLKYYRKEEDLCLLIGQDQFEEFHTWHKYIDIINEFQIIVFRRSNKKIIIPNYFKNKDIVFIKNDIIPVSSTEIRKAIKLKEEFRYKVTEDIWTYIIENDIYYSKESSDVS